VAQVGSKPREATSTLPREDVKRPPMYKVLLHNDDYTTMDFVVAVLQCVFGKPYDEAVRIMLAVHHQDMGVAGVYPAEIAETKIDTVHALAREREFPLRCSMEPE